MFKLQMATDNAAFEDGAARETARILREVADALEGGQQVGNVRDVNGNRVGEFALTARRARR